MNKIALTILILISLTLSYSVGYLIYQDNKYVPPTSNQIKTFSQSLQFSSKFIKEPTLSDGDLDNMSVDIKNVKINAWIPTWAMKSALKSLEAKKDLFESVSPIFYSMAADGSINVSKEGLDKLQSITSTANIKIIPSIAGFDAQSLSIVLNDPDKLNRHVAFMMKEVDDNNFDGLDLDYESTFLRDKDKFYDMLKRLSTELHSRNKVLTVTVLSKWGDQVVYGFMPETREVQDYTKIAEYADQIRIMTYDYTSSAGTNPGPVAPLSWMKEVLDYSVKRIPRQKIVLGVNLYGYAWPTGEASRALDYGQVANLKNSNNTVDTFFSSANGEGAIKYTQNGKLYFGYYATPESVKARLELAAQYGIYGVSYWRLGDDPL